MPIPEGIGQGDPVLRERGATVYARLCAACHGSRGEGNVALQAPQLCRQHAGYLSRRLAEIAANQRGDASPAMVPIAAALTAMDRDAIASWLAATPCKEAAK
ncbi:MAG: hypothetical protein D6761_13950 [Candidatus Dadabacteria bacterium]|nr:MAG: hypothetical protein D6761_13950 [Candidatus Dadabacteria bacterium]